MSDDDKIDCPPRWSDEPSTVHKVAGWSCMVVLIMPLLAYFVFLFTFRGN